MSLQEIAERISFKSQRDYILFLNLLTSAILTGETAQLEHYYPDTYALVFNLNQSDLCILIALIANQD